MIKEAGTQRRPSSDAFEYRPSPTSPIFNTFNRRSTEVGLSRSNSRRESKQSIASLASLDRGTQTASFDPPTIIEEVMPDPESHGPLEKTTEDLATISDVDEDEFEDNDEEDQDVIIEEPTVAVQCKTPTRISPVQIKPRLVTIPKRIPPQVPPRSPFRRSRPDTVSTGSILESISDVASVDTKVGEEMSSRSSSPYKSGFYGDILEESGNPWHDEEPVSPLSDVGFKELSITSKYPIPLSDADLKDISGTPTDLRPIEDVELKEAHINLKEPSPTDNEAVESPTETSSVAGEFVEELKEASLDKIANEPKEHLPIPAAKLDENPINEEATQGQEGFQPVPLIVKGSSSPNENTDIADGTAASEPPAIKEPNEQAFDDSEAFHSVPTTPIEIPGAFY